MIIVKGRIILYQVYPEDSSEAIKLEPIDNIYIKRFNTSIAKRGYGSLANFNNKIKQLARGVSNVQSLIQNKSSFGRSTVNPRQQAQGIRSYSSYWRR